MANLVKKSIIFYLVNNNQTHLSRLFKSLELLQTNFLNEFSYPVVIGHEGLPEYIFTQIKELLKNNVYFYNVNFKLPEYNKNILDNIPERFPGHWDEHAFFSLGYRHMCRFYAGDLFNKEFFSNVKYFMRMDCDSYFTSKLPIDPFKTMETEKLVYGTTGDDEDMDYVIEGLNEEIKNFFQKKYKLNLKQNKMFKTHFEILDFQWFKNSEYTNYYNHLEKTGNIYIKRWGDGPIRYYGLMHLAEEKIKIFSLPYKHGGDV